MRAFSCLLIAVVPCLSVATAPATVPESRGMVCHDPSEIVVESDTFWFFGTGNGVDSFYSADLQRWQRGPSLLPEPPAWIADLVPENEGHFWAPDVIKLGDTWHVYYSISSFGKNTSAIALATSPTLDPDDPDYAWTDRGPIVRSVPGDDFNAIDPALTFDADGRLWMSFGSFWGGMQLIELDPATGLRIAPDAGPVRIAARAAGAHAIEAPEIYHHGDWYYLFVNWGLCCRGVESTYNIRVGRSRDSQGPYIDRDGVPMLDGGGTLVLGSEGDMIGPGHVGILEQDGRFQMSVHFYNAQHDGRPELAIFPLTWDADDWPVVGRE